MDAKTEPDDNRPEFYDSRARLLTVRDAAVRLNVEPSTVERLIKLGQLAPPFFKFANKWQVVEADLADWLAVEARKGQS